MLVHILHSTSVSVTPSTVTVGTVKILLFSMKIVLALLTCCLTTVKSHRQNDNLENKPLLLTPLLEQGSISEAKRLSRVTNGFGNTVSFSGYFTVNKTCESNIFFWFFPAQKNPSKAPVVLFLQGGPGASSIYSLFEEVGPVTFKGKLGKREYSWNRENNLLFIDQPVGTGYSFTGKGCYAQNITVLAEELYSSVTQFYQLFPEYIDNKFFITGYSYAGKFIPALGIAIHRKNPSARTKINLKGLMIGNGWMDALYQNDFGSYLYQIGLIDTKAREDYYSWQQKLEQRIKDKQWQGALEALTVIVEELHTKYVGNVSGLNYLRDATLDPTPYEAYIQSPEIRRAIHVGNTNFSFINDQVAKSMGVDPVLSVKPWVEELLEHYKVVFYTGQLDIVCAYPFLIEFLRALNWSGAAEYKNAERQKWCIDGRQVGYTTKAGNLYDVFVRNAGHSVPYDYPLPSFVLVNSVTAGSPQDPFRDLDVC